MSPHSIEANTWFAVLKAARESGDRNLESTARRELEAVGYHVTIRRGSHHEQAQKQR